MIEIKLRHKIINNLARPIISSMIKKRFNYKYTLCDIKPPFIVLGNHTTDYDAFFIAKSFKNPIYFVMSDHITTIPVLGKLIKYAVSPIPITKSSLDPATIRDIFSVIKQGSAIGLFPEGNKSFSGDMSYIKPSTSKLLKKLNVPVVIYNIKGGYFSSPRWSKEKRTGHVCGFVRKIIMPEELNKMSTDELYNEIVSSLRINAYDEQEKEKQSYNGKSLAKNIESLLYVCPHCKSISSLHGNDNNTFTCNKCMHEFSYDEYGYVHNASQSRLDELDKMQKKFIKEIDYNSYSENDILTEAIGWEVSKKINKFKSINLGIYSTQLYKNRIELVSSKKTIIIQLSTIAGYAIEGQNGIQLWLENQEVYRLKNSKPISGLKYVNMISALTNKIMKF